MIDLLKKLIAIPRPSRGEDAGADFLEGYMRGIGLDVKRKGNRAGILQAHNPAERASGYRKAGIGLYKGPIYRL